MPRQPRSKPDDATKLLAEAMGLIADEGWHRFSFSALSRRSGVPLDRVYAVFPCRHAILKTLGGKANEAMLASAVPDLLEQPAKDRLFELLMSRLDALKPYKDGVRALVAAARRDPVIGLTAACNAERTIAWVMDAAGLERRSLRGLATSRALGLVALQVGRVWLDDDADDLPKTMAELDKRLAQIERFPGWTLRAGEMPSPPVAEADEVPQAPVM
ncbi:hypothetical protein [Marinivivus vitaminiproducens]|uniref:hypothetical protein n=1 Tax=Marinivivus vitaminiproducens TaxID=3035935 RepID=UPI0027A2BBA0|nr:hypothetical protein P4R82_15195 [Geminicoccaceae bacterium SCSIO 64248]